MKKVAATLRKTSDWKKHHHEFLRGVRAAADVASTYNSSSTHEYRLDDCIAMKLNAVDRARPRKNKDRVESPVDAEINGIALALAEMHRLSVAKELVRTVAHDAGLSIKVMKMAEVAPYDWKELRRAGVREK